MLAKKRSKDLVPGDFPRLQITWFENEETPKTMQKQEMKWRVPVMECEQVAADDGLRLRSLRSIVWFNH